MGNQSSCKCPRNDSNFKKKQSAVIQVHNTDVNIYGNLNFQKQSTFKKLQIAASQFCISSRIGLQYSPLVMRLLAFKHQTFFKAFLQLPEKNGIQFMNKIGQINLDQMDSLYQNLILNQDGKRFSNELRMQNIQSCQGFDIQKLRFQQKIDVKEKGYYLLKQSKVAIVFMCGGPSSRFYFQDKFLYPLQLPNKPQLLTILFNKLRQNFRTKKKNQIIKLTIIIIGNQLNIKYVEQFMKQNQFFYFSKQHIYFTWIPSIPILDQNGKICLNFQYDYLKRPKGSASYIQSLIATKALDIFQEQGVQYIHFVGTQNINQNPGDPLFIGLTHILKREISIKCTTPINPFEKFDRIVTANKKLYILDLNMLQLLQKEQLWDSLIAMNSMIFSMNTLNRIKNNISQKLQLSKFFRVKKIIQNYYNFQLHRPQIGKKCYTFQKDIKDYITCSKAPLILKVKSQQFIPIQTLKGQYSVKQASQKYSKLKFQSIK